MEATYENFVLVHEGSLKSSGVPQRLWKTLYEKICGQKFDAGEMFGLAEMDETSAKNAIPRDRPYRVVARENVSDSSGDAIWLVDHCWTFRDKCEAADQLKSHPGLADRMKTLMGLEENSDSEKIVKEVWKYTQTYQLTMDGVVDSLWYVLDEFGSRIRHHGDANFRLVPFFCQFWGYSVSLLFPRKSVGEMEEITRDFCPGLGDDVRSRVVQMLPWVSSKLEADPRPPSKPKEFFDAIANKLKMTIPGMEPQMIPIISPPSENIKIFTTSKSLKEELKAPMFEFVENKDDADVLWLGRNIYDFLAQFESAPHQIVNCFPFDFLLSVKMDLAQLARRSKVANWMAPTYDILTELENFCVEFRNREASNEDNFWILKGLRVPVVSNNLDEIVSYKQTNRPIVIQKFISNQVTFAGKPLAVRVLFFLKSIAPIEGFMVDEVEGRIGSKPLDLNKLTDRDGFISNSVISKNDLVERLESSHELKWDDVRNRIKLVIRSALLSAISKDYKPPASIMHYAQSRGLYAADFLLEKRDTEVFPILVGMDFSPSTATWHAREPNFTQKLFKSILLDEKFEISLVDLNS